MPRYILCITVVHLPCEKVHSLNPKKHQKKRRDSQKIGDTRDRVQKWDDLDFEAEIPLEHAEGSEDAKDAENFEDFEVEAGDDDGDEWDEHDNEIEQVPVVFEIAWGTIEKEALHDDVNGAFKSE